MTVHWPEKGGAATGRVPGRLGKGDTFGCGNLGKTDRGEGVGGA